MDHSLGFARHFARLVEQLLNDRDAYDVQLASLQLLVSASREGPVILGVREWRHCWSNLATSIAWRPSRDDTTMRKRAHSVPAFHGESVTKCCSA